MKRCFIALFAFALALATRAGAQDTLSNLVADARVRSPEIGAARAKWDAAQARIPGARALPDPTVGADFERKDSTKFAEYSDIEYMAEQDFPGIGKRDLAGRAEQGMARQAEMTYRMTELEIVSMTKRSYYDLWQIDREIRINRESQGLLGQFVAIATAKYEVGKTSQANVLKAKTELSKLIEDESDLNRMRETTRTELNRVVGRLPSLPVAVDDVELVPAFALDLDQLEQCARERNPSLIGAKQGMIAAAQSRLDLARKVAQPDFQVRVEARHFDGNGGIQEYDTGLFLSFPWLNRSKNRSAIAEAKASLTGAELDYDAMQLRNEAEVEKLYHGIHTMQHHYELYNEKILPQQRATVEAARAAYESDRMDFLDLLDAQRMLLDFEMQNLHHAAEAFRLAAELETYTGGALPSPAAETKP